MKVRPLGDRVLIERSASEEARVGSIIIPDTAREKPQQGVVVAVGKGRVSDEGIVRPLAVAVGDTVLLGRYAGTEITVAGQEFLIVREDEVLGIIGGQSAPTVSETSGPPSRPSRPASRTASGGGGASRRKPPKPTGTPKGAGRSDAARRRARAGTRQTGRAKQAPTGRAGITPRSGRAAKGRGSRRGR